MPLNPSIATRCNLFLPVHRPDMLVHRAPAATARFQNSTFFAANVQFKKLKGAHRPREITDRCIADEPTRVAAHTILDSFSDDSGVANKFARLIIKATHAPPTVGDRYAFLFDRLACYSRLPGANLAESVAQLEFSHDDPVRAVSFMFEYSGFELIAGLPECEAVVFSDVVDGQEVDITSVLGGREVWFEAKLGTLFKNYQTQNLLDRARARGALLVFIATIDSGNSEQGCHFASLTELEKICDQGDAKSRIEFFQRLHESVEQLQGGRRVVANHPHHVRIAQGVVKPKNQRPPVEVEPLQTRVAPVTPVTPVNTARSAYYAMRRSLAKNNQADAPILDTMLYFSLSEFSSAKRDSILTQIWHWIGIDNQDMRFATIKDNVVDIVAAIVRESKTNVSCNLPLVLDDFAFGSSHTSGTNSA